MRLLRARTLLHTPMKSCRVCSREIPPPEGGAVGKRGRTTYCSAACHARSRNGSYRRSHPAPRKHGTDNISYMGAHTRVRNARGSASQYACRDCGSQAAEWAYNHVCPRERAEVHDGVLMPYSPDPTMYDPLCKVCHFVFDSA